MESLIKYRLPDDDEGFWIYDAVQAMGLPAFTEYEEKVEKALDKLCPGKYYDILNDIPAAKHDLFVKLCCRYIHTHPEVYFSDFSNSGLASFTFFTANNNDQLLSYIDDEIDADMKNIIQIVKTANEAQQKAPAYSSLSIIPVVIGRISSSVKDIEL